MYIFSEQLATAVFLSLLNHLASSIIGNSIYKPLTVIYIEPYEFQCHKGIFDEFTMYISAKEQSPIIYDDASKNYYCNNKGINGRIVNEFMADSGHATMVDVRGDATHGRIDITAELNRFIYLLNYLSQTLSGITLFVDMTHP